mgnify:FL=1
MTIQVSAVMNQDAHHYGRPRGLPRPNRATRARFPRWCHLEANKRVALIMAEDVITKQMSVKKLNGNVYSLIEDEDA